MRRSPRRPLILRRRKLPFQQNDPPAAEPQPAASGPKEPIKPETSQCLISGIHIMDHPSLSDTKMIIIPPTADVQSVIWALTDEGKGCGTQGHNRFTLLCENGSRDNRSCFQPMNDLSAETTAGQPVEAELVNKSSDVPPFTAINPPNDLECGLLDNSLTDIKWLGEMSAGDFKPDSTKQMTNKENQKSDSPDFQTQSIKTEAEPAQHPMWERPPYSYMALIQFAINSQKSRRMTLKEIYTWIKDHFPYYREVAKPGWKNSIRHNLSLHDMFIRETSPAGKASHWTIRPEVNRFLTLDQVTRDQPSFLQSDSREQKGTQNNQQHQRILLDAKNATPSSEKRMKPYLPRTESGLIPVQPPVTPSVFMLSPQVQFPPSCSQPSPTHIPSRGVKRVRIAPKVSQSDIQPSAMCPQGTKETPKSLLKRQSSSSRRKQNLVSSLKDESILWSPENTFSDSDVVSDTSTFQDIHFSPITPLHNSTTLSFSSTPVKDWPLFSSPREQRTSAPSRGRENKGSPRVSLRSSCFRELLQTGSYRPKNPSIRKGLDTMNDSLSEILVDLDFPCVEEEDLNIGNISLSEILNLIK